LYAVLHACLVGHQRVANGRLADEAYEVGGNIGIADAAIGLAQAGFGKTILVQQKREGFQLFSVLITWALCGGDACRDGVHVVADKMHEGVNIISGAGGAAKIILDGEQLVPHPPDRTWRDFILHDRLHFSNNIRIGHLRCPKQQFSPFLSAIGGNKTHVT
jgi:hypothetical protein